MRIFSLSIFFSFFDFFNFLFGSQIGIGWRDQHIQFFRPFNFCLIFVQQSYWERMKRTACEGAYLIFDFFLQFYPTVTLRSAGKAGKWPGVISNFPIFFLLHFFHFSFNSQTEIRWQDRQVSGSHIHFKRNTAGAHQFDIFKYGW